MKSDPQSMRWAVLGVLCVSLLVIGLDNTILNVALPTLQQELGATTSQLQWIVDGYVLVFAGLLLSAGCLGDRFGRKRALQLGLVIFVGGSVLSALAGDPTQLIATRALMGVGAAFIMPATLSIVTNVFTDPAERARAIAIWAGFSAVGIAVGPLTGGWLLEHFWWGSVFLINVPVVAVALLAGHFIIPESRDPHAPRLDLVGAVLSIVGLIGTVYAIIEAPSAGWTAPSTLIAFGVGGVALVAFALWELHSSRPMLDVRMFRNPRFTAASVAVTLVFFALFGAMFLMTQYLQFVLGYSALEAGVRLLPVAATLMVVAPLSARLVERVGTKAVVATGLLVVATGLGWASRVQLGDGYDFVVVAQVLIAIGMGLTMAPATESIMGSLPKEKAGVGSAVNDTTREVGGALGVAVIGSVFSSIYSSSIGDALAGVPAPAEVLAAIRDSMGAATYVADQLGGDRGAALHEAASLAFVDGMGTAVLVGAVASLGGALVALLFLPSRAVDLDLVADPDAAEGRPVHIEEPAGVESERVPVGVGVGAALSGPA